MKIIKSKYFVWTISSIIILISSGEIFCRYYLGLGTPPLSVAHPTIEYMFKPNQDVYRFGNHFITNEYGMRSSPLSKNRGSNELRIVVFGDSVVNGGNLTDQSDLATNIIKDKLAKKTDKNVVVANVSAGSWGPGNWLAYVKEYGFFDADIVVLVISSHDFADNPTYEPLNKNTHPTEQPTSALIEGFERYLPQYLAPKKKSSESEQNAQNADEEKVSKEQVQIGQNDLTNFLELAKKNSSSVLVFQHYEKGEFEIRPRKGYFINKAICEKLGINPTSLEQYFRKAIEIGNNPYRDGIHPNKVGQALLAEAILEGIQNNLITQKNSVNIPSYKTLTK